MAYSKKIKEAAIKMMLPPENRSISQIGQVLGIAETTLKKWRQELRANGHAAPANDEPADQWSSQDKFLIVMETIRMSEAELSEYCRQKGLYPEQVRQWQENCQNANADIPGRIAEILSEEKATQKELRQVKRELRRKDAALAEAAALLVLRKKAEAIWGASDEEE